MNYEFAPEISEQLNYMFIVLSTRETVKHFMSGKGNGIMFFQHVKLAIDCYDGAR